ncbi:MAG: hypothetical protein P4K83_01215 [Terracidiphilus sp.]|nr:hypothetical protein [Terracidiphilus sp.]
MVLGLGITLIAAGLITHVTIAVLGLLLSAMAAIGWFRNVLPHEQSETVTVAVSAPAEATESPRQMHTPAIERPTYSFSSGVEAGLAGGVAMAAVATVFSWVKFHSLWYGINLLAAGSFIGWTDATDSFLSQFHPQGLLVALAIHAMVSVLVGLLYGAMLPIFPRKTLITAGLIAPILWSGLAYSMIQHVSPILSDRMDWWWFVASQVAYGLTAAFVIHLRVQVRSAEFQALPFNTRAGLHTDGGRHSGQAKDQAKDPTKDGRQS